jgi:hypothetical protein
MAIRREVLLIAVLLLVVIVLVKAIEFFQVDVVQADAAKFVLEDLRSKYVGADIEIMTITPMSNQVGGHYFEVKAKVTQDPSTPCPRRSHIFYNYPVQNFVPQLPEVITDNCKVCVEGQGTCTIAFPEEAIIASHTLSGTAAVNAYVQGNPDAQPVVTEGPDYFVVTWNSMSSDHYYIIQVQRNGHISRADRIDKAQLGNASGVSGNYTTG